MLKRYFCGGLVALALLGGCGENYTTTDTAATRTETTTRQVGDNSAVTVNRATDANPGAGEVPHDDMRAAPGSAAQDTGTPASYGQTVDDTQVADTRSADTKRIEDAHFVKEAATGGMKEVSVGRLATEKASSAEVKQFAKTMVEDHSKASEELKSLATREGFQLPSKQANEHSELSKLSGAAFDKKYADMMVKAHEKTVALFEKQAQGGQDPELKSWAAGKLPTLKHHLEMAQEMQTALK